MLPPWILALIYICIEKYLCEGLFWSIVFLIQAMHLEWHYSTSELEEMYRHMYYYMFVIGFMVRELIFCSIISTVMIDLVMPFLTYPIRQFTISEATAVEQFPTAPAA
jgi:hypothetical protein